MKDHEERYKRWTPTSERRNLLSPTPTLPYSHTPLLILLRSSVLCLLSSAPAPARIVGIHDWDAGSEGWTGDTWLTNNMDQGSGYLEVVLPGGWNPPDDQWAGLVWVDPSTLFAGTWENAMSVSFDFWADDQVPEFVQVMWGNTNAARVWQATVFDSNTDNMTLGDTNTFHSPAFNSTNAWGGAGTIDNLTSDLQSIDWIGVYIVRGGSGAGSETYGIDNFALLIPEPPEILLLAMTMTLGLILYRKRKPAYA